MRSHHRAALFRLLDAASSNSACSPKDDCVLRLQQRRSEPLPSVSLRVGGVASARRGVGSPRPLAPRLPQHRPPLRPLLAESGVFALPAFSVLFLRPGERAELPAGFTYWRCTLYREKPISESTARISILSFRECYFCLSFSETVPK